MNLLIADDNVEFRTKLASILLRIKGVEIVGQPGDVPETLNAIRRLKSDVILLDIHMPGGTGLDVIAAAKATKPAPIVIMLTGGPRSEYQTPSYLLGADYFFEKSSELNKLGEMLRHMAKQVVA